MPLLEKTSAWVTSELQHRTILIIATVHKIETASETNVYLSNTGFITGDGLTSFDPIISGNVSISESISMDGGFSISYGDIELFNNNGDYDSWLDPDQYVWVNRPIKVYVGDVNSMPLPTIADIDSIYYQVFSGIIADIDCKSLTKIGIKIRDKQELLNVPVSETLIGEVGVWQGGNPNAKAISPLVFGEVHNIEPTLINPAELQYRFSTGPSEKLIEIRDNGVPIYTDGVLTEGAIVDLTDSTFKLEHPAVGQITVSVQGRKLSVDLTTGAASNTYINSVPHLIATLCLQYGKSGNLTVNDLYLPSFQALNVAPTGGAPVGIYLGLEKANLMETCKKLADSIGAQLVFNRDGLLQLVRIGTPIVVGPAASTPTQDITEDDIVRGSLSVSDRSVPVAAVKIAYCKNWTVQDNLLTGIPDAHKEMFKTEWYYKTTDPDNTVQSLYKLNTEITAKETYLLDSVSANAEANRLLNIYKEPRVVYKFKGIHTLMALRAGQSVTLKHYRFGLSTPKEGQVVSVNPNWSKGTIDVEVRI